MKNPFTERLRQLITKSETELVLKILADFLQDKDESLYQQIVLHQSNYTKTEHDVRVGLIEEQDFDKINTGINYAVLQMLEEIEALPFDASKAKLNADILEKKELSTHKKVIEVLQKQKSTRKIYLWSGLGLTLIAICAFIVSYTMRPTAAEEAEKLYQAARNARHLEDCDATIMFVTKAMKLDPTRYDALNLRAECYLIKRKLNSARADIQAALRLEPNEPGLIYSTLAQIESMDGNTEGFYLYIEKAIQNHVAIWEFLDEPGINERRNEARFKNLIKTYAPDALEEKDSINLK